MLNEILPDGTVATAEQPDMLSPQQIQSVIFDALNSSDYEFNWLEHKAQPYHGVFSGDSGDIDLYIYAWNVTPADRNNPSEKRIQISKNVNDIGLNRIITNKQKTLLLGVYNSATGQPLIVAWDPLPSRNHRQKSCYVQIEDVAMAISSGIYSTKDKHGYGIYTMTGAFLCSYVNLLQENNTLRAIRKTKRPASQIVKKEQATRKKRTIASIERLQKRINTLEETERSAITKARIGQGYFKELLVAKYSCKCALCDIRTAPLLIGSHIKSWAESTNSEKLDVNNGLLLCAHHDALFDKHLISFTDDGNVIVSSTLSPEEIDVLNIAAIPPISVTSEMIPFLAAHRSKLK